jgi:hypothetical protein
MFAPAYVGRKRRAEPQRSLLQLLKSQIIHCTKDVRNMGHPLSADLFGYLSHLKGFIL